MTIYTSKAPRVNILLTVYQRTAFLRSAIDSVLSQTFDGYHVTVVDDSNHPDIRAICLAYQATRKVQYQPNPARLGIARSLHNAITRATEEFVSVLNDDDEWQPGFLEQLVRRLDEHPACAVAFCDHWLIDIHGKRLEAATQANTHCYGRDRLSPGLIQNPAEHIVESNSVPVAMGSVMRRSALAEMEIPADVGGAYDLWLACMLAATGRPFFYVPERLSSYRIHSAMESVQHSLDDGRTQAAVYSRLLGHPHFRPDIERVKQLLAFHLYRLAKAHLLGGCPQAAKVLSRQSMLFYPQLRPAIVFCLSALLALFHKERDNLDSSLPARFTQWLLRTVSRTPEIDPSSLIK